VERAVLLMLFALVMLKGRVWTAGMYSSKPGLGFDVLLSKVDNEGRPGYSSNCTCTSRHIQYSHVPVM
jgi:hypothetical protein